ncbi:hypothetical protein Patl1_32131 [Pistacia atlantica]|uniref:Uncharacterized protein n=1 Tax=Pistacia atlantica TaxID=434234 RepID=A0ACC1AR93_9ROSI|nr:hypothetical protein Patl1_32131 [Pistacia atlantica]
MEPKYSINERRSLAVWRHREEPLWAEYMDKSSGTMPRREKLWKRKLEKAKPLTTTIAYLDKITMTRVGAQEITVVIISDDGTGFLVCDEQKLGVVRSGKDK